MMYRSMMQVYVNESDKAVALYQKAFDSKLGACYLNDDGTFMHSELDIYGQILAVSEALKDENRITGTTMQFCLHFGEGKEELVHKAYDVLKKSANILCPIGPCPFSPLMFGLIDKYGVNWCVFV